MAREDARDNSNEVVGYLYGASERQVPYLAAVGDGLLVNATAAHALRHLCDRLLDQWFVLVTADAYVYPLYYYEEGRLRYDESDQSICYVSDGILGPPLSLAAALGGGAAAELALHRLESISSQSLLRPPLISAAAQWQQHCATLDRLSGQRFGGELSGATNPPVGLYRSLLNNTARSFANQATGSGQGTAWQVLFWCSFVVLARRLAVFGLTSFVAVEHVLKAVAVGVANTLIWADQDNPYLAIYDLFAARYLVGPQGRARHMAAAPQSLRQLARWQAGLKNGGADGNATNLPSTVALGQAGAGGGAGRAAILVHLGSAVQSAE